MPPTPLHSSRHWVSLLSQIIWNRQSCFHHCRQYGYCHFSPLVDCIVVGKVFRWYGIHAAGTLHRCLSAPQSTGEVKLQRRWSVWQNCHPHLRTAIAPLSLFDLPAVHTFVACTFLIISLLACYQYVEHIGPKTKINHANDHGHLHQTNTSYCI